MQKILEWMRQNMLVSIALVVALVAGLALFGTYNSIIDEGNKLENGLNEQYPVTQNELSTCLIKIGDAANLTKAETQTMKDALTEAIKGRYEGRSANPGQMFSAIVEDYPDLKVFDDAFQRAYHTIIGCRTDYQKAQNKLFNQLKVYDNFQTDSFWRRRFAQNRYPSELLRADKLKGEAAYEQMRTMILTADTREAYRTGTLPSSNPCATPSS